ncbi:MAG: hypothetical protein ALECFALPRED_006712 [Alectoria fallacina]|uniref:SGNH hydrolase-type esterase domain-containing protein n=1 Tax=Alectoria fallacina TaxID=1903189 RepID=A0A8H3GAQ1_9LECA|nr:MAG: hypothetical protein ALECFALPRED_006712 [Alectoria fallacina]
MRPNPIKRGYTAFGDSYAAGIGTGNTSTWGCRQGRFSYPDLIASTVRDIDFQNLACSGATVQNLLSGGAHSQVDAWANPSVTDIATLSIGGNDIGFYNILTACVLWVGGYWAGDCDTEVAKANEILASPDFSANIMSALKKILDKSGNDTFKIYMTGYVTFFNEITPLCESSSFRIYNPHYDTTHEEKGQPWLTTALRTQLNDVVVALNMMLSHITNSVNNDYANTQRVVFVDPNPAYTGHRWCEEGVYEPDNERLDTWLFLSSAPDNNLPDNPLSASESYNQQQSEQVAGPSFALPDPTTCRENLAQFHSNVGTDWYENMLCDIAIAASRASSFEHQVIQEETMQIKQGNLTELRIPWYVPTRLAKTFHPKTLGQQAFANEIMAIW